MSKTPVQIADHVTKDLAVYAGLDWSDPKAIHNEGGVVVCRYSNGKYRSMCNVSGILRNIGVYPADMSAEDVIEHAKKWSNNL